MPNHVTHRMSISGPAEELSRFRERCITTQTALNELTKKDETWSRLDFNSLIPMPEEIRDSESSSVVSNGLAILGKAHLESRSGMFPPFTLEYMMTLPWAVKDGIDTPEKMKAHLLERHPDCVAKAERALENLAKYGAMNWYDWAITNWGTKWNSYRFHETMNEPTHYECKFDTAWSPPQPIFEKIAEEFPALTLRVMAYDEGGGFAYVGSAKDGTFRGGNIKPTDQIYEMVYGYPPEHDEEEEDEDEESLA